MLQARLNVDTTPFVLFTYPGSREDAATLQQDAGRAAVLAKYTLLAKLLSTVATTGTADAGNTGDGTVTAVEKLVDGKAAIVGSYNLECIQAGLLGRVVGAITPGGGNTGDGTVTALAIATGDLPKLGTFTLECTDKDAGGTASAGTVTPGGGDTGDGVPGAATPGAGALEGTYVLTCIEAIANAGRFEVSDPNGNRLEDLNIAAAYSNTHFALTIADGAADFIVGDSFTIVMTIAHGGKFKLTDPDGTVIETTLDLPGTPGGTLAVSSGGIEFTITDGATDFAVGDSFTMVIAVSDGGKFKLEDPNGNLIANDIIMSGVAGGATVFIRGGLLFTITDGATDFIIGDFFAIVVTAVDKVVPYNSTLVGQNNVHGIYLGNLGDIAAATLVAGDVEDVAVAVNGIKFDENKLIIEGSGDLDDVLPSGITIRQTLFGLQLIAQDTVDVSSYENV